MPICGNGQAITFSVPQEYFVGAPTVPITDYVWQVPSGWQVVNPQTSFDFPGGYLSGRTISVIPTSGNTTSAVRVNQYSRACNENSTFNQPRGFLVSQERTLAILRPGLTITSITASRTQTACGDRRPITLTANISQNTGNSVVSWGALPAGWSYPNGNMGNPITVIPGGGGSATISATVTATCGSTTVTSAPTSVAIGFQQQISKPVLSSVDVATLGAPSLLCYGETARVTASATAGSSVTWSATNGATVSPGTSAAGETVVISAPNEGLVTVTAQGGNPGFGCQQSEPTSFQFVVNRAPITPENNPIRLMVDSDQGPAYAPVQCGKYVWLRVLHPLKDFYGQDIIDFRWDVDGQEPANSANNNSILAPIRQGQVTLITTNRCGQNEYYYWNVPINGSCSGGGVGPIEPEPCDCGLRAAYPNPADGEITVEQERGTVSLINGQGKTVFRARPQQGKVHIDTRALPAGYYFLEHRGDSGRSVRRQISINH